jgi:ABC-type bacteriocin/lantibiotic exporter with double-glycine peptidase domain
MGDLAPRSGGPPSRRSREQRAYRLAVTGGIAGVVVVVGAVLAIAGVLGWTLPILAAVVLAVCALLFRRTVGS